MTVKVTGHDSNIQNADAPHTAHIHMTCMHVYTKLQVPIPSTGDEYDYVILTTVRSQPLSEIRNPDLVQPDRKWLHENLGFVTDPHQVNVAITRAKQGLIIVGE